MEQEVDSGGTISESFAYYDRGMSSWKTSQHSFIEGWGKYSETWPRAGTMRNGVVYPQVPLGHRTDVIGSGYWPTAMSPIRAKRKNGNGFGIPLAIAARLFPTPIASDEKGGSPSTSTRTDRLDFLLEGDGRGGRVNPDWVELLMGYPAGWTDLEQGVVGKLSGTPWGEDWRNGGWEGGVPRLTVQSPTRRARVRALGNAVVPQVVLRLLETL